MASSKGKRLLSVFKALEAHPLIGLSNKEIAEHGYTENEVYRVVNGFAKGTRGKAHEIAKQLGLKIPVCNVQ